MQSNATSQNCARAEKPLRKGSDDEEDDDMSKWLLRRRKTSATTLPILLNPQILEFIGSLPCKRRFWSAHPAGDDQGTWENEILGTWNRLGQDFADVEDDRFVEKFRMSKSTFLSMYDLVQESIECQTTHLRSTIPGKKRLAIFLQWMAHAEEFQQLAKEYRIGTSTVHGIVHQCASAFRILAPRFITFPEGEHKVAEIISGFKALCNLPGCGGAVDGTFMRILKPITYGDAYYCYKGYPSILLLLCVDSTGFITYSNCGRAGSAGDAAVFNSSMLKENLESRHWLPGRGCEVNGVPLQPYIVADAAFALSPHVMKCYAGAPGEMTDLMHDFNYCVIRTRRVVENAIGRLKSRWTVLTHNFIRDPAFAADVATIACMFHNICERPSCLGENNNIGHCHANPPPAPLVPAIEMRNRLSEYVHARMH